MPNHREREYKPLLFDTTLRNPARIKAFLSIIDKYNSLVPNNNVIHLIVKDVIKEKLYCTTYQKSIPAYKLIYNDDNSEYKDDQLEDIIKNSPQDHQEGGFEKGWPSRFFTWFKFIRALGFVYFDVDKPIKVSKTGKMLIKSYNDNIPQLENAVFRNAMARFHRNSPFIMSANTNRPFPLLIATILKLKELSNDPDMGVYRFEIPYFLCWKNNNEVALANYILEQRKLLGLTPSDESIYGNVKKILNLSNQDERRYKISNILGEMPDEYIRKMRLTGMVTLRGAGRYLDIDKKYNELAKYIRKNYFKFLDFTSEEDYFNYAGEWDDILGKYEIEDTEDPSTKLSKFEHQVSLYSLETLESELKILINRNGISRHPLFKLLCKPVRLEFLTALYIKKKYPNVEVYPGYSDDDDGVAKCTAGGSKPDISCVDDKTYINVEVTMLTSTAQNIKETPSIIEHLQSVIRTTPNIFAIFIAPTIHNQTRIFQELSKVQYGTKIIPNTINEFLINCKTHPSLREHFIG